MLKVIKESIIKKIIFFGFNAEHKKSKSGDIDPYICKLK